MILLDEVPLFDAEPIDRAGWTVRAARERALRRAARGPVLPTACPTTPDLPFQVKLPPNRPRRCDVCGSTIQTTPDAQTYVMQRQAWLKIGRSKHPQTRLRELRAVNRACYIVTPADMDLAQPIDLLLTLAGDLEHELHERFADCHVAGEWFLPNPVMADWLERHRG